MDPAASVKRLSCKPSLSIVVPIFNEEENIPFLMEAINKSVPLACDDYEVILVDDASTDRSGEMLDAISRTDRKVRVLHNNRNRTLGGSLKAGFHATTKDLVLYFDADLPFDLKEIGKAIAMMDAQGADLFSAHRTGRDVEGIRRSLYSFIYNRVVELLFHLDVKDVNFSFKLFRRSLLQEIKLMSEGSFINVEMLARVRMAGRKIIQFPCVYHPRVRGRSTLSSLKVIKKIVAELTRFFFAYGREMRARQARMDRFIGALCRKAPGLSRGHMYIRYKTCPFEKIETYVPKEGKILDLGCGFGFFDLWMRHRSEKRDITALDWQEERISLAKEFNRSEKSNVKFLTADYNVLNFSDQDAILLIDTLCLMSFEDQKKLLARCAATLKPGGMLLIKDVNTTPRYKYFWLTFQELFAKRIVNLNGSLAIHAIPAKDMASFLRDLGLGVETILLDRGYWYPHIMYRCIKR